MLHDVENLILVESFAHLPEVDEAKNETISRTLQSKSNLVLNRQEPGIISTLRLSGENWDGHQSTRWTKRRFIG